MLILACLNTALSVLYSDSTYIVVFLVAYLIAGCIIGGFFLLHFAYVIVSLSNLSVWQW